MPKNQTKASTPVPAQESRSPVSFDVRVYPVKDSKYTLANANVDINGVFAIRGVKVIRGEKGPFVAMPQYKDSHGDYLGGDDTLYVFEAPIDLLSYISLFPEEWQEHNYVACCGTSSIPVLEMLRQLPRLRQVYLCLDNDAAGHAASERMAKLLEEHGISAEWLVPQQKDWNDDLKAEQENKMERSELCQTFC